MTHTLYHAPADCPVCGDQLITIRKGCMTCGTELTGEFTSCEFCALEAADLDLLKVFLASRGNLRDVEKHLGVSYPTARARLDSVLGKLKLGEPEAAPEEEVPRSEPAENVGGGASLSPQEQILRRVQSGELSSEVAAQLLAGLDS